jgi:hypothetical protein
VSEAAVTRTVLETISKDFTEFGKKSYEQRIALPGRVPLISDSILHVVMDSHFTEIMDLATNSIFPELEKEVRSLLASPQGEHQLSEFISTQVDNFHQKFIKVLEVIEVNSALTKFLF